MKCAWCGTEYDPETRRPMLPGPDGQRYADEYCSGECALQAHDDLLEEEED